MQREDARLLRLDLERPGDLLRLDDPEAFFAADSQRLICVDEIQRRPELFPVIRYWGDRDDGAPLPPRGAGVLQ